jgi:predicted porin
MKYLSLLTFLLIGSFTFAQFGVKVNYASYNLKVSVMGASASETVDGFGVGLDYAFELGETTLIAGLSADFLSEDGESETVIIPSAVVRYPIGDSFGLRGGLALVNWSDTEDPIKASLLHLPLGLDFGVSDNLSIIANYSIALGDRLDGEGKFTDNNVNVGLHYSF